MSVTAADYLIIGGGIAGASIGYWLAPHARVVLLERESQPGYHSTGRSAALFYESYGPQQVRALTCASRAFFENPPAGFTDHPILTPRGALMVAAEGQEALLDEHEAIVRSVSGKVQRLDTTQACELVPALRRDRVLGAVYEQDASDMDVRALHQGYLRGLRAAGGIVQCVWAAGQGGYGIQSSAAAGELYASLLRGIVLPPHIAAFGTDPAQLSPSRIR